MSRSSILHIYVTRDLAAQVRAIAKARDMSASEWLRSLVVSACESDVVAGDNRVTLGRLHRQALFAMVGIDALLAGHPDPKLRERAHQAFTRKCREAGIVSATDEGGRDEA